jgi:hypothetical protein
MEYLRVYITRKGAAMLKESPKKEAVAYVAFKTFLTALESLEHGVPEVIDRSVWPNSSGATISQLLLAFRFLGLVTADNVPTADLDKLVNDKEHRKATLRRVLERSYPNLIKRDLTKMTLQSFKTAMHDYGVEGETYKKAVSFFLQAARYSELPLSPYILKQTRAVSTKKRRTAPTKPIRQPIDSGKHGDNGSSGPTKKIELGNGINLSLTASADMFKMEAGDRAFVIKLLEEMEAHEAKE